MGSVFDWLEGNQLVTEDYLKSMGFEKRNLMTDVIWYDFSKNTYLFYLSINLTDGFISYLKPTNNKWIYERLRDSFQVENLIKEIYGKEELKKRLEMVG